MPPFVRPIWRARPPFLPAGSRPCPSHTCFACAARRRVRFKISGIDHHRLWSGGLGGEPVHHPGKHPHVSTPLPTVVEHLGGAILVRSAAPTQAIAIDEYIAAQDTSIIDTRHPVTLRKERPEPNQPLFRQPVKIAHSHPLKFGNLNHASVTVSSRSMVLEPKLQRCSSFIHKPRTQQICGRNACQWDETDNTS